MTQNYTHFSIDAADNPYASLPKYQDDTIRFGVIPNDGLSTAVGQSNEALPTTSDNKPSLKPRADYKKKKQKGPKRNLKSKSSMISSDYTGDVPGSLAQGDNVPLAPSAMEDQNLTASQAAPAENSVFDAFYHPNYNRSTRSHGPILYVTSPQLPTSGVTQNLPSKSAPASMLHRTSHHNNQTGALFGGFTVPQTIVNSLVGNQTQFSAKNENQREVIDSRPSSTWYACFVPFLVFVVGLVLAAIVVAAVFANMPL